MRGHVVATDIDTRLLDAAHVAHLEVRMRDLANAALERNAFDLVHARHVLIHVPKERLASCLRNLTDSLVEGGAILLGESDFTTNRADPSSDRELRAIYAEVINGVHRFYESRGMDLRLGSNLAGILGSIGIDCDPSERRMRIVRGGSEEARFHKTTFTQLRNAAVTSAGIPAGKYDEFLRLHDDPNFSYRTRTTVATWGTRAPRKTPAPKNWKAPPRRARATFHRHSVKTSIHDVYE